MRRLAMLLALLSSTVIAFVAPAPVSADPGVVDTEPIAHIFDQQTKGPTGLPIPNDEMPWGLDRIDARIGRDNSYTYSTNGAGVKVYVVDTGVKSDHTYLTGRVAPGWSYRAVSAEKSADWFSELGSCKTNSTNYTYNQYAHPFDVDTFDSTFTADDTGGSDNQGHGTHVAGTVGGSLTGVAKGVTIVPVRVLNSCGRGREEMVRLGLEWILANRAVGERSVVNMSIGFDVVSSDIDTAVQNLIAAGVPVIAAAGNSSTTSCNSTPAGTTGTISVGASEYDDVEAEYSNFGQCVDIFAPGSDIVSSWPMYNPTSTSVVVANAYTRKWGTSMAAPHVAGAVARYLQGKTISSATPSETWDWLKLNATCNAISYYAPLAGEPSRAGLSMTPNRLLGVVEAPSRIPCAPASITAAAVNGTATVEWMPVASDNGSETLDYTVTLTPGGSTCTKTPAQTRMCTFTGLTSGKAYTATVRARNSVGIGTGIAASTQPGLPKEVTDLAATVNGNALDVTWVKGAGDEVGVSYTATASPGGATCTTTSTGCSISGLTLGTEYTITVVGENLLGTGTSASLLIRFVRAPLRVTNLDASVINNALLVSWARGTGDTTGVTYTATASPGGFMCTSTATSCSITGLTVGTEYTITVVGANTYGTGTGTSLVKTFARAPLPVTNLAATSGDDALNVGWQKAIGEAANTSYTATAMPGGFTCTSTATSCSIAGLTVGTEYTITVVGANTYGLGTGTSLVKTFSRLPLAVAKLVVAAGDHSLVVSWQKASGEAPNTSYRVTATPSGLSCMSTSTTCSIASLVNGTVYSITVVGVNEFGAGAATTAKGTPDGTPDVPLEVQSVLSKRSITLSWPAITTSSNVTYVVSSRPGNLMCITEQTTCEVTGLSYGVDYSFSISTRSSTGLTSSAALVGSARPGFKIKKSVVKRGSSTSLTNILVPLSTGKRTWSETGPCSIRGTRLIAPKRATKCVLILKVAKKGSYPAMSTRLKVTVK